MDARNAAREYLARGFAPIPIPNGSKAPVLTGWQNLKVTDDDVEVHFDTDGNVGLLLGTPSAGLIDIDLDAPEAVQLAAPFLPDTDMVHGRAGKPRSHFWYRVDAELHTKRYQDVDGTCLVEIRGTGGQTVVPPSIHPGGDAIEWVEFGEPATVSATELRDSVSALAAGALLVSHYPKPGSRQDFALALAGTLLRGGWPEDKARDFIRNVAQAAGDEEAEKRAETVAPTAEKIRGAGHHVTGLPTVARLLGDEVARRLSEWLGLSSGAPSNASAPSSGGGSGKRPDRLQQLFALVNDVEFFHSRESQGFATVTLPTGPETYRIQSRGFMNWLCTGALKTYGFHPREQMLKEFCQQLTGKALFECPRHDVHLRVAGEEDRILLDLADPERRVVEVTADGWSVIQQCPIRFYRPSGMEPIPYPHECADLGLLFRQFFNYASEDDLRLLLTWCMFAWNPAGPYPILVLGGEAGTAKSTMAKMLRQLVDPNSVPMQSFPRSEHDFMIAGHANHVLCFDNLSGLTDQQSDVLCRAATGGGFSARQLYSDFDEALFTLRRPVIVNGIDDLATRPDLIDRAIAITMPTIPPQQRLPESHLMKNFEAARPHMIGGLLTALAAALRNRPSIVLPRRPRMADYASFSVAAERALGWPPGGFMEAFDCNRRLALQTGVESSVVAPALFAFMEERTEWQGTATELLGILDAHTGQARAPRGWPRTASQLGNEMRRLAPAVRAHGIDVTFPRSATRDRARLHRLTRTEDFIPRRGMGAGGGNGHAPGQLKLAGGSADAADSADGADKAADSLQ